MHPYGFRPAAAVLNWCRSKPVVEEAAPDCPRCASSNTKFCYYNNYNLKQPRYLSKGCRRYWTMGGSLRNVPVGGRRRRRKKRQDKSTTTPSSEPAISDLRRRPSSSTSAPKQPDTNLVDMAGSWLPFQQTAADSGNNADGCIDKGIAMLSADIRGRGLDVPEMTTGIHHVEPAMEYSVGSSSNSVQQSQFRFHQRIVDVDDQLRNMGWSRPSVDLSGSFETQAIDHGNYFQCERLSAPCLMPEVAKYVGVFEAAPTDNNSIMPCTTYAYKFQ